MLFLFSQTLFLSFGIAKVDIFSLPANFSAIFFKKIYQALNFVGIKELFVNFV